jgi:multidrug efflux pump subunit AcrB
MLLGPRVAKPQPHGSVLATRLQLFYSRLTGRLMRSAVPAYVLVAAGIVVGGLVWSQTEHTLIPSFKETDVFVEVQGPAGTSLQAMDRATGSLIRDLRGIPGVRNAAAQIGRALFSHELMRIPRSAAACRPSFPSVCGKA